MITPDFRCDAATSLRAAPNAARLRQLLSHLLPTGRASGLLRRGPATIDHAVTAGKRLFAAALGCVVGDNERTKRIRYGGLCIGLGILMNGASYASTVKEVGF